jgi:4-hydroxy-tetrahydrodipicolinate reductase
VKSLAIVGGAGRMGQMLAAKLGATSDFRVTTLVDLSEPNDLFGATFATSLAEVDPTTIDVVVDFSSAQSAVESAQWCAQHHVALVIGTTGLSEAQRGEVDKASLATGIIMASNFSIGMVLQQRFAVLAAPYFDRVEIIELHHDRKADAPSGTSLTTASAIAQARRDAGRAPLVDPTTHHTVDGARGADGGDGVMVHSLRLPGLVSHQEIHFGSPGEGLSIRHDSFDRESFVQGVVLAVNGVGTTPGLTIGIDSFVK